MIGYSFDARKIIVAYCGGEEMTVKEIVSLMIEGQVLRLRTIVARYCMTESRDMEEKPALTV